MTTTHVLHKELPLTNRRISAAVISAVGLLSVAACSGTSSADKTENTAASTAVLTVASSASVTTWDPIASFSTEAMYMGNLYEPLLWRNPAGSDEDYTPALATGWTTSDDGLTWTFDIREGVTFHSGEALDADRRAEESGGRQGTRRRLVHLGAGRDHQGHVGHRGRLRSSPMPPRST